MIDISNFIMTRERKFEFVMRLEGSFGTISLHTYTNKFVFKFMSNLITDEFFFLTSGEKLKIKRKIYQKIINKKY